jgi:hypothetical protein
LTIMALKGPLHKWKSTQVCPYWWWDHEPFSSVYSTTISQHMSYHILQPCNTILSHLWPTQCHSSQFEELMKGHLKVKMHGLVQKTQIIQCLNYVDIAFMRSHITSLNYCILQREKPKLKPHLPSLAHVTHICEGRRVGLIISWNIRYTIQHWVLLCMEYFASNLRWDFDVQEQFLTKHEYRFLCACSNFQMKWNWNHHQLMHI